MQETQETKATQGVHEARRDANALHRAVLAGDEAGRARVLASHPSYLGRPAERLGSRSFTLRDAQWTVAREHGFDTWPDFVAATDAEGVRRFDEARSGGGRTGHTGRAFAQARLRGHDLVDARHVLVALLFPPEPTMALAALTSLGLDPDAVALRVLGPPADAEADAPLSMRTTPALQVVHERAAGLAVALGHDRVRDEDVLLAFAYEPASTGGTKLDSFRADPDDVVDALAGAGADVPAVRPPVPQPTPGVPGPTVYYPTADAHAVSAVHRERYPPGSAFIGFNHSRWKPGYCYLSGTDDIDLEGMVRGAVEDPGSVVVVDAWEASRNEAAVDRARRREDALRARAAMRR